MEGRSPGHGHDHAHGRNVNAGFVEEISRPPEDPHVVFIEPEHDAQVDRYTVTVKACNDSVVVVNAIVRFVRRLEALL
jgi:hypothetical protein